MNKKQKAIVAEVTKKLMGYSFAIVSNGHVYPINVLDVSYVGLNPVKYGTIWISKSESIYRNRELKIGAVILCKEDAYIVTNFKMTSNIVNQVSINLKYAGNGAPK